ncbi:MAG: galactose oxidase-like domain-containing protein [Lautropia sp.]
MTRRTPTTTASPTVPGTARASVALLSTLLVLAACSGGGGDDPGQASATLAQASTPGQDAAKGTPPAASSPAPAPYPVPDFAFPPQPAPAPTNPPAPATGPTAEPPAPDLPVAAPSAALSAQAVPASTTGATLGAFGPVTPWQLIPVHVALMPDGRVVYYGTDTAGRQSGLMHYAIWDPALGTGPEAHTLFPNTTNTDVFCSAQTLLPSTGSLLITGGDITVDGTRNYSNPDTNVFGGTTLKSDATRMSLRRWYPTMLTLPSGEIVVMGGSSSLPGALGTSAATPEVYSPGLGWRPLPAARNDAAYGSGNWYYPRAFVNGMGSVSILTYAGDFYELSPTGDGTIARHDLPRMPAGNERLPSVMFAPGKVLSVRNDRKVIVADLNGATPSFAATEDIPSLREHASAVVLPDGKVMVSGGSAVENQLVGVESKVSFWDPATGAWENGAEGALARLYHSNALLMPDATVVIAGGGAPGPLSNLNAEIYYPPYLYRRDGSGLPAERPEILSAPAFATWNQRVTIDVRSQKPITRVSMVRVGSATHSFNPDQRFQALDFESDGDSVRFTTPRFRTQATPGFYMVFAIDEDGVPSVARIVRIGAL